MADQRFTPQGLSRIAVALRAMGHPNELGPGDRTTLTLWAGEFGGRAVRGFYIDGDTNANRQSLVRYSGAGWPERMAEDIAAALNES
jgi:hypothetical protein